MTVKLPKVGNNLVEENNSFPERIALFQKHVLSTNFHGSSKEE